jgi:glycosyltransferase involved in cell wall biosynthesis
MMKATIIIPVFNGSTTLPRTLQSLERQHNKQAVKEVILIDDCSSDTSRSKIKEYAKKSQYKVVSIFNEINRGLASNYNIGIERAKTSLYILMHQDITLIDPDSISKILQPFKKDTNLVGCFPSFTYTFETWKENSFWQQVLFSRIVNKPTSKLNGKFDCIRKNDLRFDEKRYRTAGEDFDFEIRLKKQGEIKHIDLEVSHIQENNSNFPVRKLLKKEAQLAECYGVNLRRYPLQTPLIDVFILLSRIAYLGLLIIAGFIHPILPILLLCLYAYLYTAQVYTYNLSNPKIILLPFINILNLVAYNIFFLRGFVSARQRI